MSLFSRRNRKKALYAFGFFGVLALLVWGIAALRSGPSGPPEPTVLPTSLYRPIVQEKVVALPYRIANGRTLVDVVVQLRNSNARAGVSQYPIDMKVFSAEGEEILTHREITHVLPGSLQYVVAIGLELPSFQTLGRVEVILPSNPAFQELPEGLAIPTFSTFLRERTVQNQGSLVVEAQTGLVKNTGTFDWQKVEVVAVALNSNRDIIAAGKTFLGRLTAGEQREFTVQWPVPTDAIQQVIALPSTDMFSEENVVEILGDPGSLR